MRVHRLWECNNYESIYNVNPLYLPINYVSGYIEEKNGDKYLIFDSVDENKEALKKYADVWGGIKNKIKATNGGLPLNKPLKFNLMTIIIRCVFSKDGRLYPQLLLDDTLYKLI